MELVTWNLKLPLASADTSSSCYPIYTNKKSRLLFFSFRNCPLQFNYLTSTTNSSSVAISHATKRNSIIEQVSEDVDDDDDYLDDEEDDLLISDDFGDEEFMDDGDYFEDEYVTENAEVYAGDGAEGGGILLAGTWWDKEALAIAEDVTESLDGNLKIYAFRTLANATIQVRIEKLSTKYGSPNITDIEAFSAAYRARLDEAEQAKTIPENISLEVSSPGVERVIRIPQELDRFRERPMYVKYLTDVAASGTSSSERDGVFRLVSFDLETNCCTWGLADVRINREKAGKGRPMSKKQQEWRLTTPFDSLRLVRLYSEI